MAKYYLQWVRGNQKMGSMSYDAPEAETNPWSWTAVGNTYALAWADFANTAIAKSNKLTRFPQKQLFGYNGNYYPTSSEWYILFTGSGTDNVFDINQLQVGDVLYIGRQLAGSHLTVTGKGVASVTFNYVCGDGTVAYSNVSWQGGDNSTRFMCMSLPWVSNKTTVGNYSITGYRLERNYQFGYMINTWANNYSPTSVANAAKFWNGAIPVDEDNPYDGAGGTGTGGGDPINQNWDDDSDTVTDDGLPTIGAVNSGMISLFSPTKTQLQDLADLLFSYNFFDWLQKNLQNLEELIVSLAMVPFAVTTGGSPSVTFLGFDISQFTHPVYLRTCTEQYYEIDMGSILFDGSDSRLHASDSVFDYSPFSRLGIYLPFIGYEELNIDEVRGTTMNLRYKIDVLSGSCVAIIRLSDSQGSRDIYQFSGNCLTQLPLGSTDMSGIVQGSINIAIAAASAGASEAIASAGEAVSAEKLADGGLTQAGKELADRQYGARVSNSNGNLASATANGVMGMKPNFKHSGAIGAAGSMLAVKQPYVFLTTPREAVPSYYQKYCGLPCNITDKLGNFSGYTVVEDIRLNGLVATSPEVEEIYQLLKTGVII